MSILRYESYGGLTGRRSDYEELLASVRSFSRDSLLWHCAAINYGARVWESNRTGAYEVGELSKPVLGFYFRPQVAAHLYGAILHKEPRIVFHRRQLLALQKLALVHAPESGPDVSLRPYMFGRMLLMVNDHLHDANFTAPIRLETVHDFAKWICEFLPISESGDEDLGATLARNQLMLGPLTRARSKDRRHYDARKYFEQEKSIDSTTFTAFLFAIVAYLNARTFQDSLKEPGNLYFNHHRFSNTALSQEQITALLNLVSKPASRLKSNIGNRDFGLDDNTEMRKIPMVRRWLGIGLKTQWAGDLVLDPVYLWERLLMEPYWLSSKRFGAPFRSFWGDVFEDYCNKLMGEATSSSGASYLPNVLRKNKEQLSDGLLLEGDTLVIIEYKGFMLSAEAKYSGDPERLLAAIQGNLVKTEAGQKKGVEQIAEAAEYLFGKERFIEQVFPEWRAIKKVFPCIITLDSIGGAIGISTMLQLYARPLKVSVEIAPVFCVPISQIEKLAPYFRSTGFVSILKKWLQMNPTLGTPLSQIEMDLGEPAKLAILDIRSYLEADASVLLPNEDFAPSDVSLQ